MSQHDMTVDNGPGLVFRGDINNALKALASQSGGAAAPGVTFPSQLWADTGTGRLRQRNAANSIWLDRGPLDATLRDAASDGAYSADTGTTNAFACSFVPAITARSESSPLRFKVANGNSGASTINDGFGTTPLVGQTHAALQGGETVANGIALIQWNGSIGSSGAYVLIYCTGAAGPAVNQVQTAFTTAGTAPAFTLTPTPALDGYAPNKRYRVKFSAAATSGTLNVSGLGPKNLKQYDSTGAKVATVVALGQLADVEYDGTDWVVRDPLPASSRQIQPFNVTAAANALTLTLNPTSLDFRSSPLSSGAVNSRFVSSPISLVVPPSATLGTTNGVASRLVGLAIDNAGTVELAVVNLAGGLNLDETTLISTTAISAGATAANVIYSATARTNVPFRIVGFADLTQATAGTWVNNPATTQGAGGQAIAGMSSIGYGQTWQNVTASRAFGTTYTNTTGKPIQVLISYALTLNSSSNGSAFVDGVAVATHEFNSNVFMQRTASFLVPNGSTYSITGTVTKNNWAELR